MKSYGRNETVLTCTKNGEEFIVTPATFNMFDYAGVTVKGESYYVIKAVKLGAKKPIKRVKKVTKQE